jgi:lipoprotein-anchoring transpeptidase ErfK/SrfK
MNIRSLTLYSVVLLGAEYLLFGMFGLFILVRPALASVAVTPTPAPEILWATVNVPKPGTAPTQVVSEPPLEAANPTESPVPAVNGVDDGSVAPNNPASEYQAADDGRWIDVNLSEQQIYAYEGDILVNSFIVSTGLPDTPTVTGEYNIYVKVPMQDMSGPGYYLSDVPWVMFFYDDYGFHGTYWHNNFGSPMSRGCVNLRMEDAEWLYQWASVGTRVVVHY